MLASGAFARLVLHFALHGERPQHVRGLQRHVGLSMSSLNRELARLEKRGLVERTMEGSRVLYCTAEGNPGWKTLRQMIRDFADPVEVVEEALTAVDGIDVAFVYGSFARGDARNDSDVDVFVVGVAARQASLGREAAAASLLLGRPVEIRAYTRDKLERQLRSGNSIVRRILAGPKRWLVGDEQRLRDIAA